MADIGHSQISSNSPELSSTQTLGTRTQIAKSQGSPFQLRVQVTVLRAHDVPRIKNLFGLKLFVTVASQATKRKTLSVATTDGSTVQWNENLDAFIVQPSSRFVLHLYAERFARRDVLIGSHEMIPVESQTDVPFVLANGIKRAGESNEPNQPVTLYLTLVVSTYATFYQVLPMDTAELHSTVRQAAISSIENALQRSKKAITSISNLSSTWEDTLERLKWVMDTVSPVAELSPYAKMAYGLLFAIPKTLLDQFQRDKNIRTLLAAMREAFDFTNQEDTFKAVGRVPRQAQILTLMLQHVCNCCDFIQSYAKDSKFWKRMLKTTGSRVDRKIEDFRTTLLELHGAFIDEASITTEITALQILDDVGIISANVGIILANVGRTSRQLDGMATQLKWMSSQVLDV
ncbi:hypothetical protein EI94DRAFT_1788756, partial [Lactarius quietus]